MDSGRRGGLLASAVVGFLLLSGCAAGNAGTTDAGSGTSAPPPSSTAASSPAAPPSMAPAAPAAPPAAAKPLPAVLASSAPVSLAIPDIRVQTDLISLGLRENRSLEVPQDNGNGAPASWYNGSPTPGERGPAVMLGHVNSLNGGPGVFADLRGLSAGAEINVLRADGSTAVFTVDRGATYSKNNFPSLEVYGNTDGSELRLITCDGYDPATGLFDDNYVVYAKLKA